MLFDFMTVIMKNHMLNKHLSIYLKIQINAIDIHFTKINASG